MVVTSDVTLLISNLAPEYRGRVCTNGWITNRKQEVLKSGMNATPWKCTLLNIEWMVTVRQRMNVGNLMDVSIIHVTLVIRVVTIRRFSKKD